MRYWVYDDDGHLLRKFHTKADALSFMQEGFRLIVQPKPKAVKPAAPTAEEYGDPNARPK